MNCDNNYSNGNEYVNISAGSWVHCGYHLTSSIVAPPLLSLPYAFTFLGWTAGILCLLIGTLVTFYSYNLISLVLERHAELGHRHLRFRDMAHDILGTFSFLSLINFIFIQFYREISFDNPLWRIKLENNNNNFQNLQF